MRKLIADEWMSLDGVVQGPSYAGEDTQGGFSRGGWHIAYFDPVSQGRVIENVASAGGFLFGRITYQIFAAHWPNASPEEQALAEPLNTKPKYVVSSTLVEPLTWQHTTVLKGDAVEAVRALKEEDGGDLHLIGSSQLARVLADYDLVDDYRLMIDPVVVGTGKRLFGDHAPLRHFRLEDCTPTTTGAILATFRRERSARDDKDAG
jgi:dihydrofolate reductase